MHVVLVGCFSQSPCEYRPRLFSRHQMFEISWRKWCDSFYLFVFYIKNVILIQDRLVRYFFIRNSVCQGQWYFYIWNFTLRFLWSQYLWNSGISQVLFLPWIYPMLFVSNSFAQLLRFLGKLKYFSLLFPGCWRIWFLDIATRYN